MYSYDLNKDFFTELFSETSTATMITKRGAKQITAILLYVVTPCLIVSSLQSIIGQIGIKDLASAVLWSAFAIGLAILVSMLFFRRNPDHQKKILRFAVSYSNSGFMGIPLVQAVFGSMESIISCIKICVT